MTYLLGKHPYITLKVLFQKDKWKKVDCLIDTGFSGGLSLPREYQGHFRKQVFIETHLLLADGSEIAADATYTKIRFNGKEKEVDVLYLWGTQKHWLV